MSDPLSYLDALLRARLAITEARQLRLSPPNAIRDGIVPTPRLILFRTGQARYQLEQQTLDLTAGTMLLVPALSRRAWSAVRPTSAIFFSFQTDPELPPSGVMIWQNSPTKELFAALERLVKLAAQPSRAATLLAEATAKQLLASFLTAAKPIDGKSESPAVDRSTSVALQWLAQHLADPDALEKLPALTGQSENRLRRQFKLLLNQSPRDYLFGLRMRQARFQLSETTLPVKRIAKSVGYDDPLYFSRRYHQFWKRWPTDERS